MQGDQYYTSASIHHAGISAIEKNQYYYVPTCPKMLSALAGPTNLVPLRQPKCRRRVQTILLMHPKYFTDLSKLFRQGIRQRVQ